MPPRLTPEGLLQNAPPLRSLAEAKADTAAWLAVLEAARRRVSQ